MKVFLSWTGDRCREFGTELIKNLLRVCQEIDAHIDFLFSPTYHPGVDWQVELRRSLADADLGLILLDPDSLKSPWVAFEAGFIAANAARSDAPPLFLLLMSTTELSTQHSLFERLQCRILTEAGLVDLLKTLLALAGRFDVADARILLFAVQLHETLLPVFERIVVREALTHVGLQGSLNSVIDGYETFALTDLDIAQQLRDLISTIQDEDLAIQLSETSRLFRARMLRKKTAFNDRAIAFVRDLMKDTVKRLAETDSGVVVVKNRLSVREFWLDIFRTAQKSVWTTNIANLGENMGSEDDDELIDAQSRAIAGQGGTGPRERITITRVFVHELVMDSAEAEARRRVMRKQIDVGIAVYVMARQRFDTARDNYDARNAIGAEDFMIIDDADLYLTLPGKNEIEAKLIEGASRSGRGQLEAARIFQRLLERKALRLTETNIGHFEDLG